jgi:hypothetical protein
MGEGGRQDVFPVTLCKDHSQSMVSVMLIVLGLGCPHGWGQALLPTCVPSLAMDVHCLCMAQARRKVWMEVTFSPGANGCWWLLIPGLDLSRLLGARMSGQRRQGEAE